MALPRMRTADKVIEIIRQEDPDTQVTLWFLRNLINSGDIPVVRVGNKKLVDADQVIEYLRKGSAPKTVTPIVTGIRRVKL